MKNILVILFVIVLLSCKREGDSEIAEQRNDNGVALNIPLSGSLQNPAFSPNNNAIVFTRFINGYNKEPAEIYTFDLNTEKLTLLVSDGSGNVNLPGSSWNKKKIVFASTREPHDEIYVISENDKPGSEIKITNRFNKVAYEPTFSPDREWIVFESHLLDVEGNGIITKYKIDGTSSYVELTEQDADCRQPNWSSNNTKILYQQKRNNQWNIWTMDIDGANKKQVTSNLGNCTDASFTTDGQSIVFSSDFKVNIAAIYEIAIAGTNPIKLTNFEGYDGAPSISSDGKKLIFESINEDPDDSKGTKIYLLDL